MLAVFQFDSPSLPLLEQMLEAGRLPNVAALRRRGQFLKLEAETDLFEAALFPTLYSGVEVGSHGLYAAFPWSPSEQRVRFMQDFPQPLAVWERLAQAGKRSLVIDPYQAWMPKHMAGVFLSGWQLNNRMVLPRAFAPAGALKELMRRFGPPPRGELLFGSPSGSDLIAQHKALLEASGRIADAALHLVAREAFDLVWLGFSCVHLAGHGLWATTEISAGGIDAPTRRMLEGTAEDIYAAADHAIGRVLEALPSNVDVIVASPDGMGPDPSISDMLPDMLGAVLGSGSSAKHSAVKPPGGALWRFRAAVPARARAVAARWLGDAHARDVAARLHFAGMDWSRTRAFAAPGDFHGFVRLNLRGRERDGIVAPGAEAEALLEQIVEGLMTFCDPDGAPCISSIERPPAAIRRGPCSDRLPDLVVCWSKRPRSAVRELQSPQYGRIARRGAGTGLAGNHAEGAWAIMTTGAPGHRVGAGPRRIADIAATACALLGIDATDLPGKSWLDPA